METASGRVFFLKWRTDPPAGMYEAEADGLIALATAATDGRRIVGMLGSDSGVRVPSVAHLSADGEWLLLEFIASGRETARTHEALGRGLAAIHSAPTIRSTFGWRRDNWIGTLPQPNPPTGRWSDFWSHARLEPQLARARLDGHFSSRSDGAVLMDNVLNVVPDALAGVTIPTLVHGDLWSGNAYADNAGRPVLIDPAVYLGDAEVDLAMTELFGPFGAHFYDAYYDVRPMTDAYREYRRDLYQLYYLLVHVNLFGGRYVQACIRAAERVLVAWS